MEHHVVHVNIDATVAGKRIGVIEAAVSLAVNSIPSISLVCAPTGGRLSPLDPEVHSPDIRDYMSLYRDLQKEAEGLRNSDNSVEIVVSEGNAQKSLMKVSGWILAEVGLSAMGPDTAPDLVVVIKHPICRLTKAGSIYQTQMADTSIEWNYITAGEKDLLGIVDKTYDYVAQRDDLFWPTDTFADEYRRILGDDESKPGTYLDFKGGNGIFLANVADGMRDRIAEGIGRFVFPEEGGSSTWDMLISASGALLLSITQDNDNNFMGNKLVLEPTTPWKTASVTLDDTMCNRLEAPCSDPFRISGVMCRKMGPYNVWPDTGLFSNGNPNDEEPKSEAFYAPVGADYADGRIMKVPVPSILEAAFRRDAPYGDGGITDLGVKGVDQLSGYYDAALNAYCRAVYEISATHLVSAKAHMALDFSDFDGNLILPGNTCVFKSSGEPVFYGYIQNVVHVASTSGLCGTTVSMSHVREGGSYIVGGQVAIAEGSPNAAYG